MKSAAISRFVIVAAVAALVVVGGSTAAWAATCPDTSPNFSTNFASASNCLTLVQSATITPTLPSAPITAWSGAGNIVTFSSVNTFTAGELVTLSGFTTSTYFNGRSFFVSGVTPSAFQITFSGFTGSGLTEAGTATPANNVLQLTPAINNQRGSAWFNAPQPVAGSFSTTFKFQLGGTSSFNADGFAFVIQNSAPNALGPAGCGIGFGDTTSPCGPSTGGIPNSLAVEFNTWQNLESYNGIDPVDTSGNDVTIQSCPSTGANSVDPTCTLAVNNILGATTLADGNPHTATITYTPSTLSNCNPGGNSPCPGSLDVILDNVDLFPSGGVSINLSTWLNLTNGTAFVGFTAATGGGNDNQDILNWTLSLNTQSAALPAPGVQGSTNFNGGIGNNSFDQKATLDPGHTVTSATLNVKPILIDRNSCNKLVQQTFPTAQCFVFQNADGNNTRSAVLFELNCSNAQGDCSPSIFAELANDFVFQYADNPGFKLLNSTIGPYVGVLKGDGGTINGACTKNGNNPLFTLGNQISSFTLTGDPLGGTTQKARPGTSCWTIVYGVTGEQPPGITITAPTATNYTQGKTPAPTTLPASYTCKTPVTSKDPNGNSAIGPYLTVGSCSQSQAPNNLNTNSCGTFGPTSFASGVTCNGQFDVSTLGLHVFLVTTKDTAGNVNAKPVVYNVVKPKP